MCYYRIPDLPDPESRMMAVLEWYLTSFHAGRQVCYVYPILCNQKIFISEQFLTLFFPIFVLLVLFKYELSHCFVLFNFFKLCFAILGSFIANYTLWVLFIVENSMMTYVCQFVSGG